MSHFAKINSDNVVVKVIAAESEFFDTFIDSSPGEWIQTSYTGSIRKNYAFIGGTYDKTRDAFIPPKTFASWVLDESTCKWKAPTDCPGDISDYYWDEDALSWAQE